MTARNAAGLLAAALAGQGHAPDDPGPFDRLAHTARGLGIERDELRRIVAEVEAEAAASATPILIEDRVAEARRRLFAAAGVGTSRRD